MWKTSLERSNPVQDPFAYIYVHNICLNYRMTDRHHTLVYVVTLKTYTYKTSRIIVSTKTKRHFLSHVRIISDSRFEHVPDHKPFAARPFMLHTMSDTENNINFRKFTKYIIKNTVLWKYRSNGKIL